MQYSFKAIAISHDNAAVNIREKLSLNGAECQELYISLKEILGIQEALVLSTCNRTEVYYVSDQDVSQDLIKLLLIEKGISTTSLYMQYFRRYTGQEALRRLFEVSVGLQSQVTGDLQIISQVKKAYQVSAGLGMAGPFLHRLMHTIFYVYKRIVQETSFQDGAASVSYTCTTLVQELAASLAAPKVLVIGVGEIGKDIVKNLAKTGISHVTLANRTYSKALALAREFGFMAVPLDEVLQEVEKANVVISAIQGEDEKPFLMRHHLKWMASSKRKVVIDLSVPRSIEASVKMLPDMELYNIDELNQRISQTMNMRKTAIPQVSQIIDDSLQKFNEWTEEMIFSPAIQQFKSVLEDIRKQELSRYLSHLTEDEKVKVEYITQSMIQKLIKLPVLQLKAACKRGEAGYLIDVLDELFSLEERTKAKA